MELFGFFDLVYDKNVVRKKIDDKSFVFFIIFVIQKGKGGYINKEYFENLIICNSNSILIRN